MLGKGEFLLSAGVFCPINVGPWLTEAFSSSQDTTLCACEHSSRIFLGKTGILSRVFFCLVFPSHLFFSSPYFRSYVILFQMYLT